MTATQTPNHHSHHPAFSGMYGLVAALSMTVGRGDDARTAAQLARLESGDVVVDIGCGPGAAARHAARLGATVIGIDPAPVMLRVAKLLTWGPRVRYERGTAEELPLADGTATVVWSIATVHHWSDLDAGLTAVRRVLQPGGRFVAIERHTQPGARGHASHGWTGDQAEAFRAHCVAHGFTDARVARHTGRRALVSVVSARQT